MTNFFSNQILTFNEDNANDCFKTYQCNKAFIKIDVYTFIPDDLRHNLARQIASFTLNYIWDEVIVDFSKIWPGILGLQICRLNGDH